MEALNQIVSFMTAQAVLLGMFWDPGPTLLSNRLDNVKDPGSVWDAHEWTVR
jgi:hypothetical protein